MSPIKEFGAEGIFNAEAQSSREETLVRYRELLESMGRLGIRPLCYNFMVGKGWSRTGVREGRGGAKATCFSLEEMNHVEQAGQAELHDSTCSAWLKLSHDQAWANYEYFIADRLRPHTRRRGH